MLKLDVIGVICFFKKNLNLNVPKE